MSVRAVGEFGADLRTRLPEWFGVVASRYGVPLPEITTVHDWWQVATDEAAPSYPFVHVRHAGGRLGIQRQHNGVHDSTHSLVIEFEHMSYDREAVAACMVYAPEAFLRYLDTYPLGSRELGTLVMKIAPPDGQGIRLTADEVMARVTQPKTATSPQKIAYRWGMSLSFDIEARDTSWREQP